jgi:hypothetical protein
VEFTVAVDGALGPVTWVANGSNMELDVGSGFPCGASAPAGGLSNGVQTVTACTTADFNSPGQQALFLHATDSVTGQTVTVQATVNVRAKGTKPTLEGVAGSLANGKKRTTWGYTDIRVPGAVVKVYVKPTGAKTYRLAGKTTSRPGDGLWVLRSAKVKPGKLYAVVESPYLTTQKSTVLKAKKNVFAKKAPDFPKDVAIG